MFEHLTSNYGYIAIVIGAMIEGEVALVIAGFAAYLGYMSLPLVMLLGFLGCVLSDHIYFYIGRKKGKEFIEKRPSLKKKVEWVHRVIEKYHNWVLLLFRFAYGFRAVVPFTLGTSNVPRNRFTVFNAIGAAIWSVSFSLGGYFFGTALEVFFGRIRSHELEVVGVIVVICVLSWAFVSFRKNRILRSI